MRPGSRPGPSPRGPPPNSQPMVGVMHGQGPPGTQYNAGGQGPNDWGPASQQGYANAGSNVMNGPGPQNQGAPPSGSLPPWASKASSPNAMRGPPGGQMMQQHQAPPMQHLQQPMQQHLCIRFNNSNSLSHNNNNNLPNNHRSSKCVVHPSMLRVQCQDKLCKAVILVLFCPHPMPRAILLPCSLLLYSLQ